MVWTSEKAGVPTRSFADGMPSTDLESDLVKHEKLLWEALEDSREFWKQFEANVREDERIDALTAQYQKH